MSAASEISNHVLETEHKIHWDGTHTLSHESGRFHRWFKEAWYYKVRASGNRVFHDLDKPLYWISQAVLSPVSVARLCFYVLVLLMLVLL